jgi:hypothetical protein
MVAAEAPIKKQPAIVKLGFLVLLIISSGVQLDKSGIAQLCFRTNVQNCTRTLALSGLLTLLSRPLCRFVSCEYYLLGYVAHAVAERFRHCAANQKVAGSRSDDVNAFFQIYLILPAALGLRVYSAFNRNEYQKQRNNVSGE